MNKVLIANGVQVNLKMLNRHGLIAGSTGSGKTTTIKTLINKLNKEGISVLATDVKGDLAPNINNINHPKITHKFGDMNSNLLGLFLKANEVQTQALHILINQYYKDACDLGSLDQLISCINGALDYHTAWQKDGKTSPNTLATLQRLCYIARDGGLDSIIDDENFDYLELLNSKANILDCTNFVTEPEAYAAYVLTMLDSLYKTLPEVGDLEKVKLVCFFDEAHLLFKGINKDLLIKVEQMIKLIRSKSVGVFFISQSPLDIPNEILSQLGNRIQHKLSAYTAKEQKALKATAQSFRCLDPKALANEIGLLGIGEAIISMLNQDGIPCMATRKKVLTN